MRRARNEHMRMLLDEALGSEGGTVLDAGCGDGETSRYLAERGCEVVAVDYVVPQRIAGSTERVGFGKVEWVTGDFRALDPDRTFSAVCLLNVLHRASSWPEASSFLDHAARLLRPSGVFSLSWITDELLPDEPCYLPPKRAVRKHLEARGLRVTKWREVVVEHSHASWLDGAMHKHLIVYSTWRAPDGAAIAQPRTQVTRP